MEPKTTLMASFKGVHGTRVVIVIVLGLLYSGCAVRQPVLRQPVQMQTAFDPLEHNAYVEPGENSIKGQGFLRQQGGGVVTCAGSQVMMMPATSIFREAISHIRAGKKSEIAEKIDPSLKPILLKLGQCDAQGNFSFEKLPSGAWFVLTEVSWVVGNFRQGGTLMREVDLSNDETVQVLLTEKDFVAR